MKQNKVKFQALMSGEVPTATNNPSSLPSQPLGVNSIFPPSPKMMDNLIPPPHQYSGQSPHHQPKHHKHKYDQSIRLQAVAQPLQQRKLQPGGSPQPTNADSAKDPGVLLSPQLGQQPPSQAGVANNPGTADTTSPKKRATQKSPDKAPTSMSASSNYAKDFNYQRNAAGGTNTNVITHRGDSSEFQYFQNNQQKQTYLNQNTDKDKGVVSKLGTSRGEFNLEANAQQTQEYMRKETHTHSILSQNGLLSLTSKVDTAKMSKEKITNPSGGSALGSVHAPGGGGFMLRQPLQSEANQDSIKTNNSTGKVIKAKSNFTQHPALRKPGVLVTSLNPNLIVPSVSDPNQGQSGVISLSQPGITLNNSIGQIQSSVDQANKKNLNLSNFMHITDDSVLFGGPQSSTNKNLNPQTKFLIPVAILHPTTNVTYDDQQLQYLEAMQMRQNQILQNKLQQQQLNFGNLHAGKNNNAQSRVQSGGMPLQFMANQPPPKNDFVFNYQIPSQQYAPYSYYNKNKQLQQQKVVYKFNNQIPNYIGMLDSPPTKGHIGGGGPLNSKLNGNSSPINQNGQGVNQAGHLYTYNEIRDHKKNLINSQNRKVDGLQSKPLPQQPAALYAIPDLSSWAGLQMNGSNQHDTNHGPNNSQYDTQSQDGSQTNKQSHEGNSGNKFFVSSAVVIQNFVFNLPGDTNKGLVSTGTGNNKVSVNNGYFKQMSPIQQQQYLQQLQQQLQQQQNTVNRNQLIFNQNSNQGFGADEINGQMNKNYNFIKKNAEETPQLQSNNQPQSENRGDTVLRMFLQNQHQDRIKQIYAQTGKILQETLGYPNNQAYGIASGQSQSSEQLFQQRGNNYMQANLSDMMYSNADQGMLMDGPLLLQDPNNPQLRYFAIPQQDMPFILGSNMPINPGIQSFDTRRRFSGANSNLLSQSNQNLQQEGGTQDEDGSITNSFMSPQQQQQKLGYPYPAALERIDLKNHFIKGMSVKKSDYQQILQQRGVIAKQQAKNRYMKKQVSQNPLTGKDGGQQDLALEDNDANQAEGSGVPEIFTYDSTGAAMIGRNPSSLRKQYCSSQQQIERQDKRKSSASDVNSQLPITNRQARVQQEDQSNKDEKQTPQRYARRFQPQKQGAPSGTTQGPKQQRNFPNASTKSKLETTVNPVIEQSSPDKTPIIDEEDNENDKEQQAEIIPLSNNVPTSNWRPAHKRFVNPYDEYVKEQDRIMQARKEAKEKYSKISATQKEAKKAQPLKYIIKEGNNHWIIQRIMSLRIQNFNQSDNIIWEETPSYDSLYNFKWQPWSYGIKYDQISTYGLRQLVNHIEGHENLTTKDQLFINLKSYCEKNSQNLNVFDFVPLTYILDFKSDQIYEQFDTFKNVHKLIDGNIALDTADLNKKLQNLQSATERRAINQLKNPYKMMQSAHDHKNIWLLKPTGLNRGRGIHIFTSIEELRQILIENYDVNWFTTSLGVSSQPSGSTSTTTKSVIQPPLSTGLTPVKPSEDQKKESDEPQVQITSTDQPTVNMTAIQEKSSSTQTQSKLRSFSFVVQKYIEKPMLFKKRKFDIRVWVLLSFDFKCYLFRECYVRTSCEDYDLGQDNLDKIYVHLTNNAIQKFSDNYGKFEDGNQISLQDLANNLATQESSQGMNGDQIKEKIWQQMKELIIHSLKAIKGKLKIRKYTFELIGYDFIVDEDLQSYIIEVNTNPCIEESSQLLKMLIPRMIDDMFRLTVDTVFNQNGAQPPLANGGMSQPPPNNPLSSFSVPGYDDSFNMWETIYSFI